MLFYFPSKYSSLHWLISPLKLFIFVQWSIYTLDTKEQSVRDNNYTLSANENVCWR